MMDDTINWRQLVEWLPGLAVFRSLCDQAISGPIARIRLADSALLESPEGEVLGVFGLRCEIVRFGDVFIIRDELRPHLGVGAIRAVEGSSDSDVADLAAEAVGSGA